MTEPPHVPGPGERPPPIDPFIAAPKTKKFVPLKYKVYAFIVVVFILYLLVGLLKP
jgi:hypothetical protein